MTRDINPWDDPFAYNLKRQEETRQLIARLSVFIRDEKIRKKSIKHIEQHRNSLIPSCYWISPLAKMSAHTVRSYFGYCSELIKLSGLYSLDDFFVRDYLLGSLEDRTRMPLKDKKALEAAFVRLFQKQGINKIQKRLRNVALGSESKEIIMAQCYLMKVASKRSLRDISKLLAISKDTVQKYVEHVKSMPSDEQAEFLKIARSDPSRAGKSIEWSGVPGRPKPKTSLHDYDE